jgi:hypothetical protein
MAPLSQEQEESDEEADLILGTRPFAIEHGGGSAAQDPMGLLGSAVGKPARVDASKPGTDTQHLLENSTPEICAHRQRTSKIFNQRHGNKHSEFAYAPCMARYICGQSIRMRILRSSVVSV